MTRLSPIAIEKPWGRTQLPPPFEATEGKCVGEIWFPAPPGVEMPLLVKYLFSSEKLSIQVHPSDEQAQARGLPGGKEECWYILEAEPGALLGIGTTRPLSHAELRQAALTGEIEALIKWHPAEAGMLFHIPPGTIHTIGGGISLIEIQQNSDVTYRLYDFGRPRELHLDDGVAVANATPFPATHSRTIAPERSETLLATRHFTLAQIADDGAAARLERNTPTLVIPIIGTFAVGGAIINPGEVMLSAAGTEIKPSRCARALVAWPKPQIPAPPLYA